MRRWTIPFASVAFLFTVAGCDKIGANHEIVRAGEQTLLLDKASGRVQLIEGVAITPVNVVADASGDDPAKQAKVWPEEKIPQLGDASLSIRTKYRDGKMLYTVEATPYAGRLGKAFVETTKSFAAQPTFYLDLFDADGFPSGDPIGLPIRGATRVVNEKDEPQGFSWRGAQAMSIDTYRDAAIASVRWAGFDD